MKISELQTKQGNVDLKVQVIEKENPREFEKFGKKGRVCNTKVKDESGEIKLTLWNEDIDRINVSDTLHIRNGFINEWQGEKQLTTGKFGSIEKIDPFKDIDKELSEIEKEEENLERLDTLEKNLSSKEPLSEEKINQNIKNLEKEKNELDEIEKMAERSEEEDLSKIKKDNNIEDAITLDELEEIKTLENDDNNNDEDITTDDEDKEDELISDVVEEDIIDLEENEKNN